MSLSEMFKNQIEALATELAEVMTETSAAAAAWEAAEGHRSTIAARVAALAAERDAIASRRGGGRRDDSDGATLSLIQVDTEGLHPMLREASERVHVADGQRSALSGRAAHLRAQIKQVEAQAAREAFISHARALDEKLLETVNALAAVNRQIGHTGRPVWGPSPSLYQALRSLAAARDEL